MKKFFSSILLLFVFVGCDNDKMIGECYVSPYFFTLRYNQQICNLRVHGFPLIIKTNKKHYSVVLRVAKDINKEFDNNLFEVSKQANINNENVIGIRFETLSNRKGYADWVVNQQSFEMEEMWVVVDNEFVNNEDKLYIIIKHELGHMLGFKHEEQVGNKENSIMNSSPEVFHFREKQISLFYELYSPHFSF